MVFDAIARHTVAIFHLSGERASHLGIAGDGDGALLIDGRRRAGRIITSRDFRGFAAHVQLVCIVRTDFCLILYGLGAKRDLAALWVQGNVFMGSLGRPAAIIATGRQQFLRFAIGLTAIVNLQCGSAFPRQNFYTALLATGFYDRRQQYIIVNNAGNRRRIFRRNFRSLRVLQFHLELAVRIGARIVYRLHINHSVDFPFRDGYCARFGVNLLFIRGYMRDFEFYRDIRLRRFIQFYDISVGISLNHAICGMERKLRIGMGYRRIADIIFRDEIERFVGLSFINGGINLRAVVHFLWSDFQHARFGVQRHPLR